MLKLQSAASQYWTGQYRHTITWSVSVAAAIDQAQFVAAKAK